MKRTYCLGAVFVLLCGLALAVNAGGTRDESKQLPSTQKMQIGDSESSLAVRVVGRDSDGAIRRPNSFERRAFEREVKKAMRRFEKATAQVGPDGTVSLVVAPHYLNFSVAHRAADGIVQQDCVTDLPGQEPVDHALSGGSTANQRPMQ